MAKRACETQIKVMDTVYIILLAAIVVIFLIFRFVRPDRPQSSATKAERRRATNLDAGSSGVTPQTQDLFDPSGAEVQGDAVSKRAEGRALSKSAQKTKAPDSEEPMDGASEEATAETPETTETEETPDESTLLPLAPRAAQGLIDENTLILYVVSNYGVFTGTALLELAKAEGLRLEQNVFHKYDGENNVCYRIANGAGEMGFESIHTANFQTQAIALTIAFPETRSPVRAYNNMRRFAELMVQDFGAVLKDAEHNRVTSQTLNYYKDSVVNYQLMNRGSLGQN